MLEMWGSFFFKNKRKKLMDVLIFMSPFIVLVKFSKYI